MKMPPPPLPPLLPRARETSASSASGALDRRQEESSWKTSLMVRVSRAASHCHILRALTYGDGPEILARILSHLHSDTHLAVALVSKRFYDLMITPYVWQLAFFRYFAGHQALSGRRDARASQKSTARPPRSDGRGGARRAPRAAG